ncbi:oligosaccharide flippase family protein [Paenibacillus eucommiae]|uniref:O-antigen/teichoic acid export membrane protein n=1 Tax=Paenibacillus eucommiae TaxID=1355755 RepID=A0ABS4IRU7_9BACL|nr:oligosaccharide flippase family protein [Paenibacillus eucommiae]MBP1990292.1 O-antigen/teichoic acid export membrane protein [Paenibacillus eucommiae]
MNSKTIKNIIYLFLSNVLTQIFTAVSLILVARYIGSHDFGMISVAVSYAIIAANFSDLGLTHTLIREGTKENANISLLMNSFFKIKIIFAIVVSILISLIFVLFYDEVSFKQVLFILVIPTIFGVTIQNVGASYFQVIQKMGYMALIRGVSAIITAVSLFVCYVYKVPVLTLAGVYGVSTIVGGVFSLYLTFNQQKLQKGWDFSIFKGLSWFTASGLIATILPQLGPIFLERVTSLQQVGVFSAVYRIPSSLYRIPGVVAGAFYPLLFSLGNKGLIEEHFKTSVQQTKIMSFLAIVSLIPFLFYPTWWLGILYGNEWAEASNTLVLLSFMVLLQALNIVLADSITTLGMQKYRTLAYFIAGSIGLIAYYLLGSKYGSFGGGVAAIIVESTLMTVLIIYNPYSFKLLKKGLLTNILGLLLLIPIYWINSMYLEFNPITSMILLLLVFILYVGLVDNYIRSLVINKLKRA